MDNAVAERAEEARDLRAQLGTLEGADQREIVFQDTSPRVRKVTVYSRKSGRPSQIPTHLLERTLAKRDRDGTYLFTAHQDRAPAYKLGTIKCFLHPEAEERPLLDEIGLAASTCTKATLVSEYSKRLHAQHRHGNEWALYQETVTKREADEYRARQERQTDAMLELAGKAAKKGKD